MGFDGAVIAFSYVMATILRDESLLTTDFPDLALVGISAVLLHWVLAIGFRVYQGRVAVASVEETIFLGLVTVAGGVVVGGVNMAVPAHPVPRSLPFTATFLALFIIIVGRALWRYQSDHAFSGGHLAHPPTLVIGAGWSGRRLTQSMLESQSPMRPVGFLDDDPWKRRRRHFGIPVLGTVDDLAAATARTDAQVVVIAIPSASADLVRRVSEAAKVLGLAVKVLPPVHETFSSNADVRDVRDLDMRDLLGRKMVETDIESIAGYLTGKRVLVTGAGGSIGSELCRQIDRWGPSELIMLDRDESALHSVQLLLRGQAMLDGTDVVLNDIRDEAALRRIFQARRPEVVFHAAALKHLPMLEQYPHEAMKTNVLGTANVLTAAAEVGVERFVNISTDKAADPSSVLGYSKRVAERLTAEVARRATGSYFSVRFGNVLGSRGSVLTAFTSQIANGGPVTVTHPEVTRYFMTVEEAVQLVIQAGAIGTEGEAYILDMGEPVLIEDVARQLIEQSGKNIQIVYTGLRDGEKLHEQLFGKAEPDVRSSHPLLSHAPVPPLPLDQVRRCYDDVPYLGLLSLYEEWVRIEPESEPRLSVVQG
ncbi:polysaccharide biosynthesis protein [Nocardioides piscis]|uniref:Polysaccharide biosynthesis protein n=2 Tax=Nocardioides piscis TaxID=2714938 RepID=A0A6G7YKN7_9ACTN|nr:polysaccharide biosynthesis protein [Nocardioides piscis]